MYPLVPLVNRQRAGHQPNTVTARLLLLFPQCLDDW